MLPRPDVSKDAAVSPSTLTATISATRPAYITASGRDLRIDLLRGLCVLVVIVDHVSGASPLHLLTGGDRFLTSAAEGFILISGVTAGLVYRRLVQRDGLVPSMMKALNRAFGLYLITVGLTLFLAPLSEGLQLPWASGADLSRPLRFVVSVLTLHRTYAYVDVLLLYTLLFLALPLALLLIEQRRAWAVLSVSWLVWLIYQVYPGPATFPWQITPGHLFPFAAWQVLFFTTFVASYYRDRLPPIGAWARDRLLVLTGLVFGGLVGLSVLLRLPPDRLPAPAAGLQAWMLANLFDKPSIAPGRILASAIVFGFFMLCLTRYWVPLARSLQALLLPFGQHALYAWSAHILAIVAIGFVLKSLGWTEDNPWLNAALQAIAVAAVWAATWRQTVGGHAREPTLLVRGAWSADARRAPRAAASAVTRPGPLYPPRFGLARSLQRLVFGAFSNQVFDFVAGPAPTRNAAIIRPTHSR